MYTHDFRHRLSGWLIGSLLASTCLTAAGTPALAGSIEDSVRAALTANPDVGVVQDDRRAVDQELRQAEAGYLPSLDFRGAVGPEITNNANTRQRGPGSTNTAQQTRFESELKLSQMIFDGYATQSEVERQRARQDSASYRVGEASEFVAVDAVRAHLDVLRTREIVRLSEENLGTQKRILKQVGDLERNGRGSIADVRQTEARAAEAQASLELARGTHQDAMATYQRVVGEPPTNLGSCAAAGRRAAGRPGERGPDGLRLQPDGPDRRERRRRRCSPAQGLALGLLSEGRRRAFGDGRPQHRRSGRLRQQRLGAARAALQPLPRRRRHRPRARGLPSPRQSRAPA